MGKLTIHTDTLVALRAQAILSNIGAAALNFVWTNYRDDSHPRLRDASRKVFQEMKTEAIKDALVELLTSSKRLDVEMALTLLLERIFVEEQDSIQDQKMIPALLEHVQVHSRESSNLRVISLLLLQRKEIVIRHMIPVLYRNHEEWLTWILLLLSVEGRETQDALTDILLDKDHTSPELRRELVSVMGMMGLENVVGGYATAISQHGIFAGQNQPTTRQLGSRMIQLETSLRALGGLLAGGKWNPATLQTLLSRSEDGSSEQDLYSVLLGKQYSSQIKDLDRQYQAAQDAYNKEKQKLKKSIDDRDKQIKLLEARNMGLEEEGTQLRRDIKTLSQQIKSQQDQSQHKM